MTAERTNIGPNAGYGFTSGCPLARAILRDESNTCVSAPRASRRDALTKARRFNAGKGVTRRSPERTADVPRDFCEMRVTPVVPHAFRIDDEVSRDINHPFRTCLPRHAFPGLNTRPFIMPSLWDAAGGPIIGGECGLTVQLYSAARACCGFDLANPLPNSTIPTIQN